MGCWCNGTFVEVGKYVRITTGTYLPRYRFIYGWDGRGEKWVKSSLMSLVCQKDRLLLL